MSTTHITPTTGRIVWYRGADGEIRPAIVIKGNGPFNADLYAFPLGFADADCCTKESVTHADPEQEPACFPSWHWMPYQLGQAKKAEEEQHAAKCQAITASHDYAAESLRAQVLDMALRTPGLSGHHDVLSAAAAYEAHIVGAPLTDGHIRETFDYQLAIDGDATKAAINTVRVLLGESPTVETKAYADGTTFTGTAPLPDHSPSSIGGGLSATAGLSFGTALCALKAGKRVARAGWNGKGMFVYLVPAASYPVQTGAAKAHFGEGAMVPYNAYLALKGADDTVSTWAPSGSDALAEDWLTVE
jgi:hypothetical protein